MSSSLRFECSRRGPARSHVTTARVRRHLSSTDRGGGFARRARLTPATRALLLLSASASPQGASGLLLGTSVTDFVDFRQVPLATFGPILLTRRRQLRLPGCLSRSHRLSRLA